jgi:hypothetical protein
MGEAEGQRAGAGGVWLQSGGVSVNEAGAESQRLGAGFQRVSAGDDVVHKENALERERAMLAHGDAVVFNREGAAALFVAGAGARHGVRACKNVANVNGDARGGVLCDGVGQSAVGFGVSGEDTDSLSPRCVDSLRSASSKP